MNELDGISQAGLRPLAPRAEETRGQGPDFIKLVKEIVGEANRDVSDAEEQARLLAEGKSGIVETVLALNKADLSLRHTVELRNKILDAYERLMRMQV